MRQFVLLILLIYGCGTLKVAKLCESEGLVILSDQLDGCKWFIETSDGRKLLPQNADDYHLTDRQRINFSFVPFDGMSICMAEDEIVTMTCFQPMGEWLCDDGTDWQRISWLSNIIENQNIRRVDRFIRGQIKLYQITSTDGIFSWYHCDGRLICDSRNGCSISSQDLTDQVTIFVAHR